MIRDMDSITFVLGDFSLELKANQVWIWKAGTEGAMTLQAVLPLDMLADALSVAHMLVRR